MRTRVHRQVLNYPARGGPLPSGAQKFFAKTYPMGPNGEIGFKGGKSWMRGAGFGLGIMSSVFMTDYRQKYGTGFAVMHGVASGHPALWLGTMAAELGITAAEYGYQKYNQRRRLNMGRPTLDSYGTKNAMRMESLQRMQRGHNRMRTIGNEARLLHR